MSAADELWLSAGRCWLSAGDEGQALRCFEAARAWGSLGPLYERRGLFAEAAEAYERAESWLEAAHCYRLAEAWDDAERCLAMADSKIRRAWALVHEHRRTAEAEKLIDEAPTRDAGEMSGAMVVLARCDASRGDFAAAAKKLRDVLPLLRDITLASGYRCAVEWCVVLSEVLRRPDLGAMALAMAPRGFEAEALWDRWSTRAFGEPTAPPYSLHPDEEPGAG